MEILISASLLAAFVAGLAALFAPCCVSVLLPVYLASVFRQRAAVFLMTFVFFLGILTVFLPLGLGAIFLGQLFSQYHNLIFSLGGLFLVILGLALLSGRHFSLPWRFYPSLAKNNAVSVFFLGIFSGLATTCCAPVLAGVLALALLPGSWFWGVNYVLSFVLGMVLPLFLISLFLDRSRLVRQFQLVLQRPLTYSLGGRKISLSLAEALSGAAFLVIGLIVVYLALTGQLLAEPASRIEMNLFFNRVLATLKAFRPLQILPVFIWPLLLLAILGLMVRSVFGRLAGKR